MFTVIACMIVMIILVMREVIKDCDSILSWVLGLFFGPLWAALVGGIIGAVLASLLGLMVPTQTQSATHTWQLVSLRNNEGVHGSFVLGTGSIGTQEYYFFYTQEGDGYRPNQLAITGDVVVHEEDRPNAYVVKTWVEYPQGFMNNFVIHWGEMNAHESFDFHIPRGSIQRNYSLN